jgi:hypothetical protein
MTKKPIIYKLLDLKHDSKNLWIILLPPVYALWLLAIGKRLIGKQNKSDRFFSIITSLFFALNVIEIIALPFLIHFDFFNTHRQEYNLFGFVYFSLFLLSILILTNITVKYDRNKQSDKYYSKTDISEYIGRFFVFVLWPYSIWTYQKNVNEYNQE